MSRKYFILTGIAIIVTAFAGAFSPFYAVIMAGLAFGFLVHTAEDLNDAIQKTENMMLVEDPRQAKVVCDRHGNILTYNRKGGELFGTGKVFARLEKKLFTDDEYNKEAFAKLAQAISRGGDTALEIAFGEGTKQWYRIEVRKILGRKIWLVRAKDITARRNIDDFMKQERKELGDFADNLPVGLFSATENGKIVFANARLCEWTGYSLQKFLSLSVADLFEGGDKPDLTGDWTGDIIFKTANGSDFKALVKHAAYSKDGETFTRSVVIRDAAKENEWESALKNAENHFLWLFKETPFGIALTSKDGVIKETNPALIKILGREEKEIIGRNLIDCLGEENRFELNEKIAKVLNDGRSQLKGEVRICRSGEVFGAEKVYAVFIGATKISGYNGKEEINGLVFHFFETTEWKNLELQFEQAQKMQAMGQIAGGVAHDFNNLLTAILGFCDFLLHRHGPGDPSFADIIQIQQNSNRAANLVRQLLAFSRKQSLTPKVTDTYEAFADIMDLLRQLVGRNIEIRPVYDRNLGYIRVDQGQFVQVFVNLAVNAKDAMAGNGVIIIKISNYDVSSPIQSESEIIPVGKYVMFEFSDSGCGIKKENLRRIFEPFFSTKSASGAGTGLGLATVYGIVRQTEGFIKVESEEGKGTTFTILLPRYEKIKKTSEPQETTEKEASLVTIAAPAIKDPELPMEETAEKENPSSFSAPDKRGNILLTEDENAVRLFASRALKNRGYQITACASAEEALEVLQKNKDFDLLLTDMTMPGMDGAHLAKEVKNLIPEIKIIIMSGFSEDIARGKIADNPDIHFLGKPFNMEQIISKVKDIMV